MPETIPPVVLRQRLRRELRCFRTLQQPLAPAMGAGGFPSSCEEASFR